MVWVKICGVTTAREALCCLEAGADAVGINFYHRSLRSCDPERAREIVDAIGGRIEVVGVFVDASLEAITELRKAVGFDVVQLHGAEPPEFLLQLLPHAYKGLRVRGTDAIAESARYGGQVILLDSYMPGVKGGTGTSFDWAVAREVARIRQVVLAGGLTPTNVAEAISAVLPYGVDTASGVESAPGIKDLDRVRAFVRAAKELRAV
jgi:phosphoribosylanthranilate isomerase